MSVSKRKRFEVFKRDGFTCQYCGRTPPSVVLECDHVTPSSKGGSDESHNLLTSCFDCNRGKSDVPLSAVIPTVTERLEREKEAVEQAKKYNAFLMKQRRDQEADIEAVGLHWYTQFMRRPEGMTFNKARSASVRTFLKSLTRAELLDAVERATAKVHVSYHEDEQAFRYFCGICWGKIRDRNPDGANTNG